MRDLPLRTILLASWSAAVLYGGVTVRFDPSSPSVGPYPTDVLTVDDASQKTGRRVNLPLVDCKAEPSTCEEITLLNQLDGFNVNPRMLVRFSAPVNADTLRDGMFLVALENLTGEEYGLAKKGDVIPINQVIYDPSTDTAYAKPDPPIDQHRRFLLVVTTGVLDGNGQPVSEDPMFVACLGRITRGPYCGSLATAVSENAPTFYPRRIVAASIFTTMSATDWLEKARAAAGRTPVKLAPSEAAGVVKLSEVEQVVWRRQTGVNPTRYGETELPIGLLTNVAQVAFGSFRSPKFLDAEQVIPPAETALNVPAPPSSEEIFYVAFLPNSPKPAAGYPVVVVGHGLGDSRFGAASFLGSSFAGAGYATIAIEEVGHGYGADSRLIITKKDGSAVEIPAGGRGVDLDGNGTIDNGEGCVLLQPALGIRDCLRQSAVDFAQLVRALGAGADLDGDGSLDLDPSRVYYVGQSLGAMVGTVLMAIEPDLPVAALNVGGGTVVDIARWSPSLHVLAIGFLLLRSPPLLNGFFDFDEDYVLRYQPAHYVRVQGAIDIQNYFERLEWLQASGDPFSYAPHLVSSTLPGVPIKRVLWLFGKGDQTVPNPAETALVRAANMQSSMWLYRHDLARQVAPELPADPHTYLTFLSPPLGMAISLAVHQQIVSYFMLNGTVAADPNIWVRDLFGMDVFEMPAFLPETSNY